MKPDGKDAVLHRQSAVDEAMADRGAIAASATSSCKFGPSADTCLERRGSLRS